MAAAAGDLHASVAPGNAEIRILAREWEALFLIRYLQVLWTSLPNIEILIGSKHWPDLARWEADLVLTDHAPASGNLVTRKLGRGVRYLRQPGLRCTNRACVPWPMRLARCSGGNGRT
jgi:hypothetical protein